RRVAVSSGTAGWRPGRGRTSHVGRPTGAAGRDGGRLHAVQLPRRERQAHRLRRRVHGRRGRQARCGGEYVETPWDSMFAALQAKRFDVVANQVTFNEERNSLYDLSDPYIETTGVL